ncbi:MAG: hypothetical protein Q4D62_15190 [Planctomycetia bacterium]|nr:hypothetical protein [Planctomycetia bacterium]
MVRTYPWEISDVFWVEVEPLIPTKEEKRRVQTGGGSGSAMT